MIQTYDKAWQMIKPRRKKSRIHFQRKLIFRLMFKTVTEMGQTESKSELKEHYPFYPTDFDIKRICNRTDLNRNEVQLLWNQVWINAVKENGKVDFENFVKFFCPNAWVSNFIVHCCINCILRYFIHSNCVNMICFVF